MKEILGYLFDYKSLTYEEAKQVLSRMAAGEYSEAEMAAFLSVYIMRSIKVEELQGFRDALLELRLAVNPGVEQCIDLCGTGGDGKNTFNISTLASFVVAGAGFKVAKHGNYGVSSGSGSSNMMEFFGYRFSTDEAKLGYELREAGICYMHAPLFHPAMKAVGPVRRNLKVKTFFNMLGPMVNPAMPTHQLVGVFSLTALRLYQYLYQAGGRSFALLHSLDGYDEVSLTSPVKVVTNRGEKILYPRDFGSETLHHEQIAGGSTIDSAAKIFGQVLSGKGTTAQNRVVLANAALAVQTYMPDERLTLCLERVSDSLFGLKAMDAFNRLISLQ